MHTSSHMARLVLACAALLALPCFQLSALPASTPPCLSGSQQPLAPKSYGPGESKPSEESEECRFEGNLDGSERVLFQRRLAKTDRLQLPQGHHHQHVIPPRDDNRTPKARTGAEAVDIDDMSMLSLRGLQVPGSAPPNRQQFHFGGISITVWCTMWLSMMMLGVHISLAAVRNSLELTEGARVPPYLGILEVAAYSSPQAAALCSLFVACRMYILASTDGKGNPSTWIRGCMILATMGVTLQVALAVLMPRLIKEREGSSLKARVGDPASSHLRLRRVNFPNSKSWYIALVVQLLAASSIHGGAAGVVVGIFTFASPFDVSPAVVSAVLVITVFLLSQAVLAMCTASFGASAAAGIRAAAVRAKKAPMIAVFFIAVRMRNLFISPPKGLPEPWVANCFYVVVLGLVLEMMASWARGESQQSLLAKLSLEGRDADSSDEPLDDEMYNSSVCAWCAQQASSLLIFGGLAAVGTSVALSTSKEPLSPMMKVVSELTAIFFGVHVLQWLSSFWRAGASAVRLHGTAQAAGVPVSLAPLLSNLFLACRMRALQFTDQQGAPHWWAQDSMKLSVAAILMQVCCCVLLPVFSGASTTVDGDGNAEYDMKPLFGAYLMQMFKYVALLCIYASGLAVCGSIFMMYDGMSKTMDHPQAAVKLVCQLLWWMGMFTVAAMLSSAKVVGFVIKWAIESLDEKMLGVNIHVGKAALSLCHGYIFLSNVKVDNPAQRQFASPALLKIGTVVLKVNLWRILRTRAQEIEITTLIVAGIAVNYEKDLFHTSNVQVVADYMAGSSDSDPAPAASTSDPGPAPAASTSDSGPAPAASTSPPPNTAAPTEVAHKKKDSDGAEDAPTKMELHRLILKDIGATVWTTQTGRVFTVALGDVEEKDYQERYAGKGQVLAGDIVVEVLKTILSTIKANASLLLHPGTAAIQDTVAKVEGRMKTLFSCLPCSPFNDQRRRSASAPAFRAATAEPRDDAI